MRRLGLLILFCGIAAAQQSKVDLTAGWNYSWADQGTGFAPLNGWFGSLTYNAAQHVGLTFEHESYWGPFQGSRMNEHVWLGGVTLKPGSSESKVSFFVQPLVGDTRSSSGSIQHEFTFQLAGGFDVKMGHRLALEITPAQYVLNYVSGRALNSYAAAAGIQMSFGSK